MIMSLHLGQVPVDKSVRVEVVARGTPGFSGADLANLVNVAAIKASQDNKNCVRSAWPTSSSPYTNVIQICLSL